MNGGPSGFHNAPATRAFVIICTTLTVLSGIKGRSANIGLSQQDVFRNFNFWKFILSVLTFSSTPELMFGSYLLYYFRVFERQIGSNKYSVFILFSIIVSLLFEVVTLKLLDGSSLGSLTPGPYGLIFSSFVPFFFDIPVSTWFLVFGIRFSDKSFIYLAGLQLLFSSWKRSIISGICGVLAGSLYRFNILHIRRMKFPKFITSLFSAGVFNTQSPSPPPPAPPRATAAGFSSIQHQVEENRPSPGEESIGALVSMGFDRNAAIEALTQARNDVNTATNILLEAQSH